MSGVERRGLKRIPPFFLTMIFILTGVSYYDTQQEPSVG